MSPARRKPALFEASPREIIRLLVNGSLVFALWRFVRFAAFVNSGVGTPPNRPTVADAFLPLGGATALKSWLATGQFDTLHPAALVILLATLLTAWLFRRALCSWLCPLGMVSEYLARLGARLNGGRNLTVPRWLDRTLLAIKYVVSFGIIVALFGLPASAAAEFMRTPFYTVADMKLFDVYASFNLVFFLVVGLLLVGSMLVKNLWCRYACPYGALQGILGLLSPVRIVKAEDGCTACGRCNRACPNAVDVAGASGTVISAECMGCTSCVSACPKSDVIGLKVGKRATVPPEVFGTAFLIVFLGVVAVAAATGHWESRLTAADYRNIVQVAAGVRLPL